MTTTTRPRPMPRLPYQIPLRQSPETPLQVPLEDPDGSRPLRATAPKKR